MPASTSQGNDDGWDSSLERLWELEQQAEVTPDLLSTSRTFHRQGSDADQAATVAVRAKASQRRLQNRKLAQKRYRERQKERETAELDQARKQLQLSLHHQKALETEIRKLQIQVHSSPSEEQERARSIFFATLPSEVQTLVNCRVQMKLLNETICFGPESLSKLGLAKWKQLYKATVCSLHHALDPRQLNNTEMDNMTRLKQLTLQGNCLLLSVMTHDLSSFTEIYRTGLDDDRLVAEVPEDVMAAKLAVLDYTDKQIADLLMLKQLVLTRLQQIDQARTETFSLAAQHARAGRVRLDVAHENTTAHLDSLNAQTYQTIAEFCIVFQLGIHTTRQFAVGMVYSYPRMFGLGDIEALESRSVLASSTVKAVSDAAAKYSWDDVTQYLQLITLENLHEHVPLLNRQALDHIL